MDDRVGKQNSILGTVRVVSVEVVQEVTKWGYVRV